MSTSKATIGARLRTLREEKRMKLEDVAARIGRSLGVVSAYEVGRSYMSVDVLDALADFYGVSTDYILGRTEKKSYDEPAELGPGILSEIQGLIADAARLGSPEDVQAVRMMLQRMSRTLTK